MKPRVSVIGAGRMGSALVRAFLAGGYATSVWNRTPAKSRPLAALGAQIADTVQDAVITGDMVVVNVNDYATSSDLLQSDGVAEGLRGKLLVQLTSGSPRQARDMAMWAQRHDVQYLDGAIMATPNLIGGPECTILYAGPGELFEQHKPILRALGENALHVGSDVGHASALDSALLVVMWGALFGGLHGAAICQAEEISLEAYMRYLEPVLPQLSGWVMEDVKRINDGRLVGDESTLATVDAHYGAFRCLMDLCRERGVSQVVPSAFDHLFRAAIEAGHVQDDFAVLSKFVRADKEPIVSALEKPAVT
jgi:3-hydroxyisobutyrate dehydrogenase-like beta-hydroxyacid dehydrogenase